MSAIKKLVLPPNGLQGEGAGRILQVVQEDDRRYHQHQEQNMIDTNRIESTASRCNSKSMPLPSQVCQALIQVPNRHTVASIPGDLVLGILVPVHERPSPKQAQTRTCGTVREQYGIQRVEVAFKTIDSINADPNILPNITLGIEIRDSCWHSPIALEQSIEFIRDAMAASEQSQQPQLPAAPPPSGTYQQASQQQQMMSSLLPNSSGSARSMRQQQLDAQGGGNTSQQHLCAPYMKQQLQLQQASKKIKNLVGVVGPASSGDTVQVQNLLQLFNMPQVGYSATSRDLSNKNFFKYFLRVVPSDKLQAQVLIDLMLAHNWTYITVVYTEGSYGSSLMNAFRERAQEAGICFATLESVPPNADDAEFDELIEAIQNHRNARVVICMCEGRSIGRLFAGFKRKNVNNEYLVVGSDGWADRFDVVERQEEIALGGISIRIHSAYVHDFDDHYFSLNPLTNHRNPWFAEFWEQRFQCNLEYNQQQQHQATQRPAHIRPLNSKVYNRSCTGRESLRQNYKQDAKMAFVQKSIITMALGLDSMQRALCGPNKPGLCSEMLPINGSTFLQHLMNVSFTFLDELVYFDEQGDPPGKYEILNFQRKKGLRAPLSSGGPNSPDTPTLNSPDDSTVLVGKSDQKQHNYDSYATLKVHRSPNGGGNLQQHQLVRRQVAATLQSNRRQQQLEPYVYSGSDYSATNSYEYVHVGSWKSSDGLSLFGEIQWPTRATTFQHYPSLSGGGGGGGGSGSLQGTANGSVASAGGAHSTSTGAGSELGSVPMGNATSSQQQDFGQDAPGGEYQPDGSISGSTVSSLQVAAPKSVCALPCARGHAKKIQSDSVKCCWVCVPCRPREYLFNEFKCKACEKGWWPNKDQTGCEQIPIEHFDWRSLEASVSIGTAMIGLILTLTTAAVFIKHNNTPVVKSTTRELSYMILFSMFLCYINTFFLIAKPSQISCFVTRILPGFSFAMMYGALVTKTNRIARILAGAKKKIITRRPYFMSATAQVFITWLIVLVECAIIVVMLIREPADKTHEYPSDERVVLVCNTTTMGIMAPLGFDFFLIAMCTLYAFKTRNVPENFNEAKFIGFTMYTTLVIWIAFVVIYLSSEHKVTTLCLCISFSALFALFLLFFPRCYIIIFKPEKNNRSYFKTTKNVRCHIGYQLGASPNQTATSADRSGSGSGKQNDNEHQQRLFLASLCEVANQKNADCNDGSEFYFDELSSQLADELATALTLDGTDQQQQQPDQHQVGKGFRGRTSCCKVSPAATLAEQQQQTELRRPLASSAGGAVTAPANNWLAAQTTIKDSNNSQTPADEIAQNNDKTNTVTSATKRQEFGDDGARSKRRVNSDFTARSYSGRATTTSAGSGDELTTARRDSAFASAAGDETNRPFLVNFFSNIKSAFARRSRRKESDKTATIQQHLRAIRHAENLDRQTHFRRSQVQRLIQRFDSNTAVETQNWPTPATSRQRHQSGGQLQPALNVELCKQHNLHFSQQLREFLGDQQAEQFQRLDQSDESRRLLAAMSQLIGYENLWRLASVLSRYCKQQQQQKQDQTDQVGPLDLRRAADRRLALVWLRFLIQMAQKALESVQLLVSAAAMTGNGPQAPLRAGARGLLRARASLSAQQSRDLITMGFGGVGVLRCDGHAPHTNHQTPPLKTSMDGNLSKFQVQVSSIRSSASLDNKLMSAGGETSGGDSEAHQSGLVVGATNETSATQRSAQGPAAASNRLEASASGQTKIEAATVTTADTERVSSTAAMAVELGETCAASEEKSNGRRAPEDSSSKQCDDEDPIKRALERITGQRTSDETHEVGSDRHHRHYHHHHHHHRHHHHQQQHLSMSNKSQQQARLTMNLNRGDDLETALSLRRSLTPTTNTGNTTTAPMATVTRADKQKRPATATDMNEEVVLAPSHLLGSGQRDQRRPAAITGRLVEHNSDHKQHRQKQASGGGEATRKKNWMNSSAAADDKYQDTRLHFEPTTTVKDRDNEFGESFAANEPNDRGHSEAASSNTRDLRKPNNLPPNATTSTLFNEPATTATRFVANQEATAPINETTKTPLGCCCCAASARASDGNVAPSFLDRPSRRSACSSSGQRCANPTGHRQQQQRSASGSLGRRARCCSCCCEPQVCCCQQRARHHHRQRPVSASAAKSQP